MIDLDYGWEISTTTSPTIKEEAEAQDKVCKTRFTAMAPTHYSQTRAEPWDAIKALNLNFMVGNVLKYLYRKAHKGQLVEDSLKALNYLLKEISDDVTRAQVEAVVSQHIYKHDIIDTEA